MFCLQKARKLVTANEPIARCVQFREDFTQLCCIRFLLPTFLLDHEVIIQLCRLHSLLNKDSLYHRQHGETNHASVEKEKCTKPFADIVDEQSACRAPIGKSDLKHTDHRAPKCSV